MDGHDERQFDGLLRHHMLGRVVRLAVGHGCRYSTSDAFHDAAQAARIQAELDLFWWGSLPVSGLGRGRNRPAASHDERARLNVTRAIRATMANLARDDSSLWRHLAATIRTGCYCSYTPIRTRRSPGSVDPGASAEHP